MKRLGVGFCAAWLGLIACGGDTVGIDEVAPGTGGSGGADGGGGAGEGGGAGGGGGAPASIDWEPCAVSSGEEGDGAACARVAVPLRWAEPEGETIEIFVKRIGSAEAPRQLWMLNGGPGASGADFELQADYFVSLDPELAVFLPDHRGTGRSTRLGCPDQESAASPGGLAILEEEWDACLAYVEAAFGDILPGFRTTEAAGDLGWLVDQTRGPDQKAVVWGGSYGTIWAQRYLALYPDQADAISMLGIAHPQIGFDGYDERYDAVGRAYLDACSADPFCSGKLGPNAADKAEAILDQVEAGHCAEAGLDRASLQSLFGYWLLWSWEERALVPAILYRLERCDPADVSALQVLAGLLVAPVPYDIYDELHSTVLATHIGLSEMWNDPDITLAELQAIVDGSVFSLGVGPRLRARLDTWPVYEHDALVGKLAPSDRPMLLVEGELDPATPAADAQVVADFYAAPQQQYFVIPGAPHSFASPIANGASCSMSMLYFYVQDPAAPVYDCVDQVVPPSFTGTPELAAYLGTDDIWENAGAAAAVAPALAGYRSALLRGLR